MRPEHLKPVHQVAQLFATANIPQEVLLDVFQGARSTQANSTQANST